MLDSVSQLLVHALDLQREPADMIHTLSSNWQYFRGSSGQHAMNSKRFSGEQLLGSIPCISARFKPFT